MAYLELDSNEIKQLITILRQEVHTLTETADTNLVSKNDLVIAKGLLSKCINEYSKL